MRLRRPRRTLPRQTLREGTPRAAEPRHEPRIGAQRQQALRHPPRVAVRHEKPGHAVADRLPETGTVGRERGRATGRRFHVGDPPPLFRARKHQRPRAPQPPALLLLRHEAQEPHGVADPESGRQPLEPCPVVAPAGPPAYSTGGTPARAPVATGASQRASTRGYMPSTRSAGTPRRTRSSRVLSE